MPRLVARLHREAFEGTLRLHSGGSTRVVYFRRGDIASAASNAEADRLHNILIREGRLTEPQVEMARSRQRSGVSLGKVLIELGFLTPSELLQGARRQVRQILAACFALNEGTWQALPGPLGPEVTNLGLPTRRLIFDALMEAGDRRAIVREMGSMETVYDPAPGLADALAALRLEPAMEEVARLIDGRATLREMSGRTRLDDFTVSRIVLALDILGLAGMSSRPEPVVASRPGRVIPVEAGDEGSGSEVAIMPGGPVAIAAPIAVTAPPPAEPAATPEEPVAPAPVLAAAPIPVTPAAEVVASSESWRMPAVPAPAPAPATPATDHEMPLPSASDSGTMVFTTAPPPPPERPDADTAIAPPGEAGPPAATAGWRFAEAAPPPAAEPPPFAREELPAFASAPQEEPALWRVDPQTGEKIHEGPIELTFDGPLAPERGSRTTTRTILAVACGAVLIAAVAVALLIRSRDEIPAPTQVAMAEETTGSADAPAPVQEPPAEADTGAAAGTARGPAGEPGEDATPPVEPPPSAPAGVPPGAADGPAAGAAGGPPPETATEPAPAEVDPRAPAAPPASPDPDDEVLATGRARLADGDVAGAAAAFREALSAIPPDRLSLQLLIACEESTIRKAHAALAPTDPLYVLPFQMQGRACHRLLWGLYADREAAGAGGAALPPYFAAAGVKPVVVSVGRLRGSP